jgi:hypothetical protein
MADIKRVSRFMSERDERQKCNSLHIMSKWVWFSTVISDQAKRLSGAALRAGSEIRGGVFPDRFSFLPGNVPSGLPRLRFGRG